MSWGKLAASAYRSSLDVVKDPRVLNKEDATTRLNICQRCDLYNHHTKRCKECGCYMLIKTKFKGSHCPIGKW